MFSRVLWREAAAAMTALVYSILHTRIYRGYVCTCVLTACTQVHTEANKTALHRAPPELWPRLGREEVRGPSSEAETAGAADSAAVSAGAADSAAVETLVALPVPGVQKPPPWVGKRFRDRFAAAPLKV
jgi:hypothetical protein